MKKFLFSLTMLAAVALAGFTTSCADGGDNDPINPGNTDSYIYKTYECNIDVLGLSSFENILVNVKLNETKQTLDLSISGLDLSSVAQALTEPIKINLDNVPYNKDTYEISYGAIGYEPEGIMEFVNPFALGSVNIKLTSEATADLYYLTGSVNGENASLEIAVIGKGLLNDIEVAINVNGVEKK